MNNLTNLTIQGVDAWYYARGSTGSTASRSTRVDIQGVKSLWRDHILFPRLGTGDTDRWRINKGLFPSCQCHQCPTLENHVIPPKWFNSLDTNSKEHSYMKMIRECYCHVVSDEGPSGQIWKRLCHTSYIEKVYHQCVSSYVLLTRPIEQISTHSLSNCKYKAFHQYESFHDPWDSVIV